MKRIIGTIGRPGLALLAGAALAACGQGASDGSGAAVLGGTVSGAPASASVAVRDASAQVRTASTDASGRYAVDVQGLAAPFTVRAQWTSGAGTTRVYAVARHAGTTDVDELSNTVATGAARAGSDDDGAWSRSPSYEDLDDFLARLGTVLKPLFDLYGISTSGDDLDEAAVRAMLRDVRFSVHAGVLTVTNRATGGVIFTGPLRDLASGTFDASNLPAGPTSPPPATCTYAYSAWGTCQADGTQTRTVISATPAGCTGTPVLTQTCTPGTPPPPACTYTYSAWGACQPNSTQTRTVVSATPAGCSGTPVLTQACTYLDGAALYMQYCNGCHGLSKKGRTAAQISAAIANNAGGVMGSLSFLTPEQIAAIAAAP